MAAIPRGREERKSTRMTTGLALAVLTFKNGPSARLQSKLLALENKNALKALVWSGGLVATLQIPTSFPHLKTWKFFH